MELDEGHQRLLDHERPLLENERDKPRMIDIYTQDGTFANDVRSLLINPDDDDLESERKLDLERVRLYIKGLNREELTTLCLDHSLCPLHRWDYAICFDDDNDECRSIRIIHPSHDT